MVGSGYSYYYNSHIVNGINSILSVLNKNKWKKEKERWREEEKDERKREGECESPLPLTTIPGSIVTPTYRRFPSLELSLLFWWISLLFVIWAPFKLTGLPSFIAALFTIARTWKQPRCPSTDEWLKKLWYIYTREYYSAIKGNTFESVLMRWMNLEPIIQSEVSQKEKDKYHILTHIYGI